MIKVDCRNNFTAEDFDFIVETLTTDKKNRLALTDLLTDPSTRDAVLDHKLLFEKIIERSSFSRISPYLYFYVLTRRVFMEAKIEERNIADYVATMLAEFCVMSRVHRISKDHSKPYHYFTDMMIDFLDASSIEAFLIRSHMGNYALFMSGIFPDYIYRKSTYGRRAPGFDYYEQMGSTSYRWAAQHRMAMKYRLEEILSKLAQQFRRARLALNRLADEYIVLDDRPESMDKMLRQIFFGGENPHPPDA